MVFTPAAAYLADVRGFLGKWLADLRDTQSEAGAYEQAAWVMYQMTREETLTRAAVRTDDFREDPNIVTFYALPSDYSRSGYDRGHLAPAEDMKFSEVTMRESFYMSNMSPQKPDFNRGVWKKLEKEVRRYAYNEGSVFVITGPVLERNLKKVGRANKVSVPRRFFKIVYDETPPCKMIAFVLPNEGSTQPLSSFVTSVDEVERLTGFDFFAGLEDEDALEAVSDYSLWTKKDKSRFGIIPSNGSADDIDNHAEGAG